MSQIFRSGFVKGSEGSRSAGCVCALLLLAFAAAPSVRAQSRGILFQKLSIEAGLSQGTVNCILQDRTGFLWFGTQDGLNRYDGYGFQVYKNDPTDPSSLPSNWVEALAEDAAGNLWVGTQGGGLARWRRDTDTFDRFRHDPRDPASLPGDSVRALLLDRAGNLWVGTFQSGLARLDLAAETPSPSAPGAGVFERYRYDPDDAASLSDDRVRTIHEDRAGDLRIGTLGGLDLFEAGGSFEHSRHDPADPASLSDNRVFAILEDTAGTLWIGTENGLNRALPADDDGRRGSGRGFERFRHDPGDAASLADYWVTDLLEDRSGRLWIATDGGLHLLRQAETDSPVVFDRYRHDALDPWSLSSDRLMAIFEDRGGVMWFGTQGGGLNKWNPATWSFVHYRAESSGGDSLANADVFAFSEDREGRLFVGTFGGLDVLDRGSGRFTHYRHDPSDPSSLPGDQVTALYHDRDDTLWVGTLGRGLGRLERKADPGEWRFRNFRHDPERPGSLSSDDVSALLEDRAGALWVATYRGGLNRLDTAGRSAATEGPFQHLRHDPAIPESLSDDHLTALAEDAEGHLWIGTFGGGLNRLDAARETFRRIRHDPGRPASLSSDTVYSLYLGPAGEVWVGTQVGLNFLEALGEESRFRHYFERDGLPNDSIWGIQPDGEGRLWLSTNSGISRFDPRAETFRNYNTSHGLQASEFNFGAHYRSRSGEIYFGGVNGFNVFRPDRIGSNSAVPPVVVTSLTKLNEPVSFGRPISDVDEIGLSYRDDLFTFEFAALDFTAPEENRYRYKLEGLNDTWIDLGTRRRVTFTDLDPGHYTLRVQGSNNDGLWNEAGRSIGIVVAPPPWQTWWAYSLFGLALAAMVLGLVRRQQVKLRHERDAAAHDRAVAERERAMSRRLREVDKLKDEFLANTSHELRTPLHGITGLTESLIDGARGDLPESVRYDLLMVVASGRRLAVLVDDLLDFSRLRHGSLELLRRPVDLRPLVEVVLTLSRPLAGSKNLTFRNAVPADLPPANADEDRLQQILHNLLGNAVKFTEHGSVEVAAERRDGQLMLSVSDTGIGIPRAKRERIFAAFEQADGSLEREYGGSGLGLAITRQLVELHGGSIWVESTPGQGSTFFFTLPQSSGQPEATMPASAAVSRIRRTEPEALAAEPVAPGLESRESERGPGEDGSVPEAFKILIADDDPVIRRVLVNQLAGLPHQVIQASSGAEAWRIVEEQVPDLVLLDIMMPKMSGYEVCRKIRKRHSLEQLPIIFLTAKDQLSDLVSGYTVGGNDYLVKPVAKDELLARVATHLELLQVHRGLGRLVEERTSQVKVLRGLLPICSSCKKIRDDQGYWNQIEEYVGAHSEAVFSHGICPACFEDLYGQLELDK